MKYFLSKKFILVFLFFAIVLIGGFVLLNNSFNLLGATVVFEKKPVTNTAKINITSLEKDTDHDGLKDWQEALWKTDPNNPDTDGDGTPDGEEVREGRDPLKPGPNDKIKDEIKSPIKTNYETKTTLTNTITGDLFLNYGNLRNGSNLDTESKASLISSIADKINKKDNLKIYTEKDLKIIPDGYNNLKDYGNNIAKIFLKYTKNPKLNYNITDIINKITKTKDKKYSKELDPVILAYKDIAQELLNTRVPESSATLHLAMINIYETTAVSLEDIANTSTDTVRGLIGISRYHQQMKQAQIIIKEISNMFVKNKIVFSENEPGAKLIIKTK